MTNQRARKTRWLRVALLVAFVGGFALVTTACGKKDDGGQAAIPAPTPVFTSNYCTGCPPNMTFLVSALGQGSVGLLMGASSIEMGLDLFGDPTVMAQLGYGAPGTMPGYFLSSVNYFGPVGASGYLHVAQPLVQCGVMPGRYTLQTAQMGVFGNDGAGRSFENLMINVLGGPAPMQMYLSGFTVPAAPPVRGMVDGRTYPYRFTATSLQLKRNDTWAVCDLSLLLQ